MVFIVDEILSKLQSSNFDGDKNAKKVSNGNTHAFLGNDKINDIFTNKTMV